MKFSTLVRAGVFSLATTAIYLQALAVNGDVLPKTHAAHRGNNHHHVHAYPHPVAVRQLGPAHRKQMDQIEAVVPGTVQFQPTNVSAPGLVNNTVTVAHGNETGTGTSNGTGTGNGNVPGTWPYKADNITACTAPTYENTSPLRTKIVRDDCHDLAKKVLTQAGYWTMYQWTGLPGDGNYTGLIAEGTCQFAVSRIFDEKLVHDQGQGAAIFGNVSSAMNNNNVTEIAVVGNKDVYNFLHAAVYDFAFQADEPYMDKMTTQGRVYCQFQGTANATLDFKLQYVDDDGGSF